MSDSQKNFSLNIPDSGKPRVVLIGGGFGGIQMLKHINRKEYQVVLIDRYNYHTFQPLLYQVATAGLEPDSVAGPLREIMHGSNGLYFRMLKVESVNLVECTVETSAGSLLYDYLIVATGAKINFFGNEGIAKNCFPLKQITHALDLRSHIFQQFEKLEILDKDENVQKLLNFVVVGAGPTGVEVCGALAELQKHVLPRDYPELDIGKVQIYLVEGLDRVLPEMSKQSGKKAHNYLEKMGVEIILNCMIEEYDGEYAKLSIEKEIPTDTLIWAAGVKGNLIEGFSDASIEKGQLKVNTFNQVYMNEKTGETIENVFAIGDVALMKTDEYNKGLPGLAQAAIQQGKQLARNLNLLIKNKPMEEFRYKNKGVMATIGRNKAIADLPGNIKVSGFLGWWLWMTVHLLFLVGFRNKAIVLANWAWNYFTFDRGIRLIIRPSTKKKDFMSHGIINEMHEPEK